MNTALRSFHEFTQSLFSSYVCWPSAQSRIFSAARSLRLFTNTTLTSSLSIFPGVSSFASTRNSKKYIEWPTEGHISSQCSKTWTTKWDCFHEQNLYRREAVRHPCIGNAFLNIRYCRSFCEKKKLQIRPPPFHYLCSQQCYRWLSLLRLLRPLFPDFSNLLYLSDRQLGVSNGYFRRSILLWSSFRHYWNPIQRLKFWVR